MNKSQPNKFITWLYDTIQDTSTDNFIYWMEEGNRFIIWDKNTLVQRMQLRLKTKNFNSFRRQLSLYGFTREKHHSKKPVFSHPFFKQDRRELLCKVVRAKQNGMKSRFIVNSTLFEACQSQITQISSNPQNNTIQPMMEFLEHIKSLDQYFGIGILKFSRVLVSLLNKAFPKVGRELEDDITNAEKILFKNDILKPGKSVNKKEILILLINGFLSAIKCDLKKGVQEKFVKEETESVNFRKSSSVSKENSIFMDEPAPLMITPVFNQFKTVDSTRSLQDHFEENDELSLLNFNLN